VLLAGRVSEELMLGEMTTGAQNDLEVATKMARRMVTEYGMSPTIGNITLGQREHPVFLGRDIVEHKDYSDDTAKLIDNEVKKIVENAYQRAKKILDENRDKLKLLVERLLEKEVLDSEEAKRIIGLAPSPDEPDTQNLQENDEKSSPKKENTQQVQKPRSPETDTSGSADSSQS
jgi:cell division protease FtsH